MAKSHRLAKIADYLRPHWRETVFGIMALLVVNGLGVYIPLLIRSGVDTLSQSFSFSQIIHYVVMIVLLSSAMWMMRMASRIWIFGVGRQVEFDLKQRIFQHLLQLEPAYFTVNTPGDLISRATSDVDNIRRLLGFAVLSLANTFFAYALTLPVMLSLSMELTLASLAVYPFMFLMVHFFSDRLRDQQTVVQEQLAEMSELVREDMSGMALIKIYAQEANERQAFNQKNQQLLAANLKLAKSRNTLFPLIGGLASLSSLIIIWLGTAKISAGTLAIGDFLALLIYVERLVFPTTLLGFTITAYQRGEVSIDRLETILSVTPKIQDTPDAIHVEVSKLKGELTAVNFNYTYPGVNTPVLENLNFTIHPGEVVAIVGPIGAGKSTLANAVPRLLDIQSGQLFLDGVDITKLAVSDLRGAIAYVPQDSFLFSTTVKNNIRYGDPITAEEDVVYAAKMAQIDAEIENFPQKYETLVGERGITLSGGQRQRTALARAMLIDAPILLLDDALSSVDNQTATQILTNLSTGTKKKTVIFITHQLSAAATSDRILVMEQGKIVQVGHHSELVEQPGLYKTLWNQHQVEELLH
ncbi:ABC transporter ATP-binding protein/permease [Dolichospermum sp. ST_sed1]|nr:ABC transporter ATP-binding protein/permease [Dolichospermum sp. ST_sed1]MDD1427636.1 ABC transporter ATP-binding protein/permease [Dolichospermum sp. ST_sed9]MDD1429697.1 ABC transporter ATP-binding protein/permease [Dolichospermum sp. ST_sed6]MDD1436476.1 ABC transporter ATP-binding protein/permease [Dolichospermum sp. ST_sed10]MDD1443357.1 ABC transporter ATP-binding protein/permease [Dolichospermum sp. ST_sed3]MDD1449036.1 ABC transporter ATP-binding protein/permease [Dolichospermum sp.